MANGPWRYPCPKCPLRAKDAFRDFSKDELTFITGFKAGELTVEPGTTVLAEGSASAHLFTVLSGWGFRYKLMDDGRRQILNFILPGDLVGLQGSLLDEMNHSVEALTEMILCVFQRDRIWELFKLQPSLGFDVTWLAAREEQILDEHLLSVGRRTAEERAAYLLLFLFSRAEVRGLTRGNTIAFPFTQPHIADTLGLSLVHTNRILNRLARRKVIAIRQRQLELLNRDALVRIARWDPHRNGKRPLL